MTPQARAARERKQKIVLVVGLLVLAGLLAIQLPKLLGGSSGSSSAEGATVPAGPAPAAGADGGAGGAVLAAARPAEGKLRSVAAFRAKDPFIQQIAPAASPGGQAGGQKDGGGAKGSKSAGGAGEGAAPDLGFSLDGQPGASVTVVSVNGTRQALVPGQAFPATDPVFVLVAERPRAKRVVVGVAGGAYENGARTTTLRLGKPLVLVNTTTGARYKLVLVAVGNGAAAREQAGKTTTAPPAAP